MEATTWPEVAMTALNIAQTILLAFLAAGVFDARRLQRETKDEIERLDSPNGTG